MDDLKHKILQQLIDQMDERSVGDIKSKMMPSKVEVEAESPEDLKEGLDVAKSVIPDESSMSENMSDMMKSDEEDEKLKQLMELYQKLS